MQNVEIRHIGDLHSDERNPRQHTPRSIGAIVTSLGNVGAWRSIAVDDRLNVIAGNGVIEAAAEAGIERVAVIDGEPNTIYAIRRKGLTDAQKAQYAVADNFIPTLSEWDAVQLSHNADDFGFDLVGPGLFTDDELSSLASGLLDDVAKAAEPTCEKELELVVTCKDFDDQQALKERLETEGYACKSRRRKPRKPLSPKG